MVLTNELHLPTEEELTVQEVKISSAMLRSAAFHLGKYCETANNEFMLCRSEYPTDPRKCLNEGKIVTSCTLEFFRKLKKTCRQELESFSECVDKSSVNYQFAPCRNTQAAFDKCMLDQMSIEKPYHGYFCEAKIHDSTRPKPPAEVLVFPDATPALPKDVPKPPAKYQGRQIFT